MSGRGPGNGDDDDDIDRLVRALENTNQNLEDVSNKLDILLNAAIEEQQDEVPGDGDTPGIDRWEQGRLSAGKADTPEEYILLREQTAKEPDVTVPRASRQVDDLAQFYFEVFCMRGDHLQKIYQSLSNSQWAKFVRLLAVYHGATEELVDMLKPSPEFFNIITQRREVDVLFSGTHMPFELWDDELWFAATQSGQAMPPDFGELLTRARDFPENTFPNPAAALNLLGEISEEQARTELKRRSLSIRDINEKLAKTISERQNMTLPMDYLYLVDD